MTITIERGASGETYVYSPSPITGTGANGDETDYAAQGFIGSFTKGLQHNSNGEVVTASFNSLKTALTTPTSANFEAIQLGLGRQLTNPQSGLATDLEGPNPATLTMKSAPTLVIAEEAAEMVEIYWMALLRDVPFTEFADAAKHPKIAAAATELTGLNDFTGPMSDPGPGSPSVTPQTLFRGTQYGDNIGPFISQYMLKDIPYGSLSISQRQRTVQPDIDYLTRYADFLAIQNGSTGAPPDRYDDTRRYIRNMRDLGEYVHVDALYEAYLNACLILLGDIKCPVDPGNPYAPGNSSGQAKTQIGFGTFGGPHILSLVCEAATRALKAVWHQKWFVHRRLRPEAYGGLVHLTKSGQKAYPLHSQMFTSVVLDEVQKKHGSYLLPMAFPEGSPTHPAYGAGHATVAGACVTVLKAWFDEDYPIINPVVPVEDGTALVRYTGTDAHRMTVGGELNKVAANIGIGRNMGGSSLAQ